MKAALVIRESSADEITSELNEVIQKNEIMTQRMAGDDFDVMFGVSTEDFSIDINDDAFLVIAKLAHRDNVTFNQEVTRILRSQIDAKILEA